MVPLVIKISNVIRIINKEIDHSLEIQSHFN